MNISFLIAFLSWITSSLAVGIITNDGLNGFSIGSMIGLLTYIYFKCIYFDEKKTDKRANA